MKRRNAIWILIKNLILVLSDLVAIAERMASVKRKIVVLSGKGGVGKSTFSAQLSFALDRMDYQVGRFNIELTFAGQASQRCWGLKAKISSRATWAGRSFTLTPTLASCPLASCSPTLMMLSYGEGLA